MTDATTGQVFKMVTTREVPEGVELVIVVPDRGDGLAYGMLEGDKIMAATVTKEGRIENV
jgi:hypothetical protein